MRERLPVGRAHAAGAAAEAEVPEPHVPSGGEEHVLGLEVAVDDALAVQVLHREAELLEPRATRGARVKKTLSAAASSLRAGI